jgi:hypothetical protein
MQWFFGLCAGHIHLDALVDASRRRGDRHIRTGLPDPTTASTVSAGESSCRQLVTPTWPVHGFKSESACILVRRFWARSVEGESYQFAALGDAIKASLIQGHPARAIHRELDFSRASIGLCPPSTVASLAHHGCAFVAVCFDRRLGRFPVQIVLRFLFVLGVPTENYVRP